MQAVSDARGEDRLRTSIRPISAGLYHPLAGMVISGSGPKLLNELLRSDRATGFPDPDLCDLFPIHVIDAVHLPVADFVI